MDSRQALDVRSSTLSKAPATQTLLYPLVGIVLVSGGGWVTQWAGRFKTS